MDDQVIPIRGMASNCYLVTGQQGLLLVDTGLARNVQKILAVILQHGYKLADLRQVVITHADVDHFGSLAGLQHLAQFETLASPIEAEAVRAGKPSREVRRTWILAAVSALLYRVYQVTPARVDRTLVEGDELPYLGRLQVLATPGHTPGHVSLYSPSTRTLFSGDSITIGEGTMNTSLGAFTWNLEQAYLSFRKQEELHPKAIYGGHGMRL